LRDVKAVVAQVTSPEGFVVLNADDPMSLSIRERVTASVILTSKRADHPALLEHRDAGGWILFVRDGSVISAQGDEDESTVTSLDRVPITFGGRAPHMVENTLSATGALLAAGLTEAEVRDGLAAFLPQAEQNRGRLNVFRVHDAYVILDFAHNRAGLDLLLTFGRKFVEGDGRLIAVVGTAGDRTDASMRALGQIAAKQADYTIFKDTRKYLRGREAGAMLPLMHEGFDAAGGGAAEDAEDERAAALRAVELLQPGDAVALMCIEDYDFLLEHLHSIGVPFTG
jgi:cyanophycin synthetase